VHVRERQLEPRGPLHAQRRQRVVLERVRPLPAVRHAEAQQAVGAPGDAVVPARSDDKVANRVKGFRVGDRSRGRYATPADFPLQDCSPYRKLRVRGWGLGFVYHSRAILCRAVPNPNITIRNFSMDCGRASARPLAVVTHCISTARVWLRRRACERRGGGRSPLRLRGTGVEYFIHLHHEAAVEHTLLHALHHHANI
jgi:hypothetical protein